MGVFKFFIIITAIYILFRLMVRYLFPYLLKRYIEKQKEKFYQSNPYSNQEQQKSEGEVSIKHTQKKAKGNSDNVGEYIDYEDL